MNLTIPGSLHSDLEQLLDQEAATTLIGWKGMVRGVFVIDEQLRSEGVTAIAQLCSQGVEAELLTGDTTQRAAAFGRRLAIQARGALLPDDKVAAVREARQTGGDVAMVGDGLNDAPALAAADVGIAMGCGADVSREAADVCLLGNNLSRLPWSIELAHRTVRIIRQNLFWSLAYNVFGIGLAVSGRLNPIWASAAMMLSSFFVVGNSLRLSGDDSDSGGSIKHCAEELTVERYESDAMIALRIVRENAIKTGYGSSSR